ncbi:MAG: lipopolysaccharide heptosyltransferase II [Phycisphaerae bacterium]|nr:lipopolysaccharide heptosyltransferase II [Phycisphaerae bacterium]
MKPPSADSSDSVLPPQPPASRRPLRILIIKPSSLGDIVHGLPVLAGVRAAYPDAHVAWLIGKAFAPLLERHSMIDELIIFDRKHYGRLWFDPRSALDFIGFVRELRSREFDLILDLQGLVRSSLLAWFTGARIRVGFAQAREFAWLFYTKLVRVDASDIHAVDRNRALARSIGLPVDPPHFPLEIRDEERVAARRLLAAAATGENSAEGSAAGESRLPPAATDFVAVLPGARWATKQWTPDGFAAVLRRLLDGGRRCILLGGPDDRQLADDLVARVGPHRALTNLVGKTTLRELAALLEAAAHVLTVDSGPMHIAAALQKPLTALFGPTNPERTGPYLPTARVIRNALPCMPCYRRKCPLGHHNCMRGLHAERVEL